MYQPQYGVPAYAQPIYPTAAYVPQAYSQPIATSYSVPSYAQPQNYVQQVRATGANPEFASYGVPTTGPDFSQANVPTDPTNLFVQNLPLDLDEGQLRAIFEPFGQVLSVKIMLDPNAGTSRGFGFVKYANAASASTAIESMHEATVSGKKLAVKHAALTSRSVNVGVNANGTPNPNLYIRGVPLTLATEELQAIFAQYGNVLQTRILTDPATGASKGQAFVRYDTTDAASYAISALNGSFIEGGTMPLLVKFADTEADKAARRGGGRADFGGAGRGRGAARFTPYGGGNFGGASRPDHSAIGPNGEANLFIYHLPMNADDNMLLSLFSPYGTIISTRVMRDPATGLCKGFGFVKMVDQAAAEAAIQGLDGFQVENKRLSVSYKK